MKSLNLVQDDMELGPGQVVGFPKLDGHCSEIYKTAKYERAHKA